MDVDNVSHVGEQYARPDTAKWREADGDHEYRGWGRFTGADPHFFAWPACLVCGGEKDDAFHGRPYRTCTFCGSVHPDELLALLDRGDVSAAFDAWRYEWPHKLILTGPRGLRAEWWNQHFADLEDGDLAAVSSRVEERTGIRFGVDERRKTTWRPVLLLAGNPAHGRDGEMVDA